MLQRFKNPTIIKSHFVKCLKIFSIIKSEERYKQIKTVKGKTIKTKVAKIATMSYPDSYSDFIDSTIFKELSSPPKLIFKIGKNKDIDKNIIAVIENERYL